MLGPLIVDLAGPALGADERELLLHPLVGAVILFARNCPDAPTVARLAEAIHGLRTPPLLVTIDQEGGRVQRLSNGVSRLPALALFGARWNDDPKGARRLARDAGWLMASELLALGVDVSFAPVLDLAGRSRVIGDRAFHGDPEAVAELGLAFARGMEAAGMRPVAKHFPGHGGVAGDTHVERPVDRRVYADVAVSDLVPFERVISAGLPGLMMNHVVYPEIAPEPASLSRHWIHDVLRGELGFQGAVVSDDLSMHAVAGEFDVIARVAAALTAGCDLVPLCNDRRGVEAVLLAAEHFSLAPASGLRRARLVPTREVADARNIDAERMSVVRATMARLVAGEPFVLKS